MKKEIVDRVAQKYSENSVFKLAVSAIPKVGSIIDIFLSTKAGKLSEERFLKLIQNLSDRLEKIESNRIRKEYADSEEFYDLFCRAANSAIQTRSELKIASYANILSSSLTETLDDLFGYEDYMNILIYLTEKELVIMKEIYNYIDESGFNKKLSSGMIKNIIEQRQLPKADPNFIIGRLQAFGLIHEIKAAVMGYGGGIYELTDSFHQIIISSFNLQID